MDGGTANLDDWDMLLAEAEAVVAEEESVVSAEELMMLRLDYFSIDDVGNKTLKYSRSVDERSELSSEGRRGSVESDNPSWIDPDLLPIRCDREAWPDSASDRSKLSDCDEKLRLGFANSDQSLVLESENQGIYLEKFAYDTGESSVGTEMITVAAENVVEKIGMDENENEDWGNERGEENCVEGGEIGKEVEQPVNLEKKTLLWWKLPIELVKFCVFKISPVWSISVAAAMLGVFIIRRRMHMMKRKSKALQMMVTMDDKKVDQFKNRAARLNEAFSVVGRVPIIRPSLPARGVTPSPWPVVGMR